MGADLLSADVTNDSRSGVYLVGVPDRIGEEQVTPFIIKPGESSTKYAESIDAVAAFSLDGDPIKMQVLRPGYYPGKREERSAHLLKYPDGVSATVRLRAGKLVIDEDFDLPKHGPSPSKWEDWGLNAAQVQKLVDDQIKLDSEKSQSLFGPGDHLQNFLKQNFTAKDAAEIYAAVQEKMKSQENNHDYTVQPDKGLQIG